MLIVRIQALLEDFREPAEEIAAAQQVLTTADKGSRKFHMALATLNVWFGGLKVLVPGILEELEELEDTLDAE